MKFTQTLEINEILSPLDWLVFTLILLLTFVSIAWGTKRKKKPESTEENFLDLLLMGRQLTLPLFIATLVATWYGGIFGVTRIAFEKGIYNFITQGLFWYASYLIFAFFLIQKIAPYKAVTLPDLISKMFGPKSAKLSAIFNFFNVLPIAYIISLGLFTQILFGGTLLMNMFMGTLVVVIYSLFGGLRAVVYSDLVQFFVMCLSVFLVLLFSYGTFGGSDFLVENLPAGHFNWTGGESLLSTFVWGFIALATLVDPNFYQRCFAAKDEKVAKKGILIATVIWFFFDISTTFGAMYARALLPEAQSSQAYLVYALQLLPDGLRGFFLAGILATILSTLDSYLFLAGTTLSYDLMPKKWQGRVRVHHLGVILVGFIAISLALLFDGNIKNVWKLLGSYFASCLLLPVLAGHLYPDKIQDKQFVFSSLLGVICVTLWTAYPEMHLIELDALYIGLLATLGGLMTSRFIPILRG